MLDETGIGYPGLSRDPLDAPLVLGESNGVIGSKQFLFDADNLVSTLYTFEEGEVMLAANSCSIPIADVSGPPEL